MGTPPEEPGRPASLAGRTVGVTAERRWEQQARFLAERGATVVHAPVLRTLVPGDDPSLRAATERLVAEPPRFVATTTGVGVVAWLDAADRWGLAAPLVDVLAGARVLARGPKAASALRRAGIEPWWQSRGERMREVAEQLLAEDLAGATVAVQLDGTELAEVVDDLRTAGARVVPVPVYRWALPADTGPARNLVREAAAGRIAALTFTSAPAVRNLAALADEEQLADAVRRVANDGRMVVACVGPVCAEAAREAGFDRPVAPDPGRLVPMLRLLERTLDGAPAA